MLVSRALARVNYYLPTSATDRWQYKFQDAAQIELQAALDFDVVLVDFVPPEQVGCPRTALLCGIRSSFLLLSSWLLSVADR